MLESLPYKILVPVAIFLAVAPINPQPHLIEKIAMLKSGTLTKPIDIFDFFLHAAPLALLAVKLLEDYVIRG